MAMQVQCGDFHAPVFMGEGPRNMFTEGTWDACGQLVAQAQQVRATASKLPYMTWSR
jgi:3-isopropylmalate/(R)-2-methylmalate dehydratase small subunit